MKVLTLSEMFPRTDRPNYGIFVFELLRHTAKYVSHKVIAPVGVSPILARFKGNGSFGRLKSAVEEKLPFGSIYRPKYLYIPGRILYCLWGYSYFQSIRPFIAQNEFDLIHAHQAYPDGFVGMLLSQMTNKPLVVTIHGDVLLKRIRRSLFLSSITRRVFAITKAVIVVANYQRQFCRNLGIEGESKVVNIPNGVDVDAFAPYETRTAVRDKLGLPTDKKIILFLGNLYHPKGLFNLIDSLSYMLSTGSVPEFRVVIVGDGPLRGKLEAKVRRMNLSAKVRFVGSQPHSLVPLWLNAADLMVLPSLLEGFPTVLPEALAAGVPVVATDVGGISQIIDSEAVGALVKPGDISSLAQAIKEAMTKKWDKMEIIQQGSRYSWNTIAKKTFDVYLRCLN